jgi:Cys-tRNA(Pro) deacylase
MSQLDEIGLRYEVTEFPDEVFTAQGVADRLGISLAQVAKAMVFKGDNKEYGIAVVPGDKRLASPRLAALVGCKDVQLVRRSEVTQATGLPVGAVTPLVRLWRPEIAIYIDDSILAHPSVNISSGNLQVGLTVAPNDLADAVDGKCGPISE